MRFFPLPIRLIGFTWRWTHRLARISLTSFLLFLAVDLLFPIHLPQDYSTLVYAADGSLLHAFLSPDDKWRMEFELDEITPQIKQAFIAKEDRYFYQHPGVNPFAALRASFQNLFSGKRISGASTITMQAVRLIEPRPRTFLNKLVETVRAMQLEWHYGKEEILRLYLNRVPCGGNIEGIKAASHFYFGKPPVRLSLSEVTTLTIIPNRPNSLKPGKDPAALLQARNEWLQRFLSQDAFNPTEIADALAEPLQINRVNKPDLAPHLSHRLHSAYPHQTQLHTTLDPAMQLAVENLTGAHVNQLKAEGVTNAAVLVIHNPTRKVMAYVGSNDFSDSTHHGQVDGLRAVRSPGSALKPLLYSLATDRGIITPKKVLYDIPANFSGYEPENYDGGFRGPVTAEKALSWSLNIPAVRLLNDLSVGELAGTLSKMGFHSIQKQTRKLGLSLALGGCGVTPEEMGGLYAMFASYGAYAPLRFLESDPISDPSPVLSPQSAWLLAEMLTQTNRPDLPMSWKSSEDVPQIAWKTGTSYGRRDAWSIGYNPRYTVVVWVGRFSGEPVPSISGAETATPLLFRIFREIDRQSLKEWYRQPPGMKTEWVCAATGLPPGPLCEQLSLDIQLIHQRKPAPCNHRVMVRISPDSSQSYCMSCSPLTGYAELPFENAIPELTAWYRSTASPIAAIPPHNPHCERVFHGAGPKITSPVAGMDYWVSPSDSLKLALQAQVESDVRQVLWYLDDRLLGPAPAGGVFFCLPESGLHKITCTDDKGRKADQMVWVHTI